MMEKMKTTAPVSSVGADGVQPNVKNHNKITGTNQSASHQKPREIREWRTAYHVHAGIV